MEAKRRRKSRDIGLASRSRRGRWSRCHWWRSGWGGCAGRLGCNDAVGILTRVHRGLLEREGRGDGGTPLTGAVQVLKRDKGSLQASQLRGLRVVGWERH